MKARRIAADMATLLVLLSRRLTSPAARSPL
jgi:hypothetical protein